MNFVDRAIICIVNSIVLAKQEFESDERGVSSVVATVLLIVIVVALAALLWVFLKDWFAGLFTGIEEDAGQIGK